MENQEADLSVVIPVFNEEESLVELHRKVKGVLKKVKPRISYEVIYVNDGSTDKSLEILKQIQAKDRQVKVVSFRINLGKAAALDIGFQKAGGEKVVTMDADLQDDPENIPAMLDKLDEGWDMVVGWKYHRQDGAEKRLPSRVFNWMARKLSGLNLHDINCGLKVMRREVTDDLKLYGELHRFVPILAAQLGYRVTELPVTHYPRMYGYSKYGWERMVKGLLDLATVIFLGVFGQRPLHFFGIGGMAAIGVGVGCGIYLSVLRFMGESIGQRPLLTLAVLLILAGLQLVSIGLIAEMIAGVVPVRKRRRMINFESGETKVK